MSMFKKMVFLERLDFLHYLVVANRNTTIISTIDVKLSMFDCFFKSRNVIVFIFFIGTLFEEFSSKR